MIKIDSKKFENEIQSLNKYFLKRNLTKLEEEFVLTQFIEAIRVNTTVGFIESQNYTKPTG